MNEKKDIVGGDFPSYASAFKSAYSLFFFLCFPPFVVQFHIHFGSCQFVFHLYIYLVFVLVFRHSVSGMHACVIVFRYFLFGMYHCHLVPQNHPTKAKILDVFFRVLSSKLWKCDSEFCASCVCLLFAKINKRDEKREKERSVECMMAIMVATIVMTL